MTLRLFETLSSRLNDNLPSQIATKIVAIKASGAHSEDQAFGLLEEICTHLKLQKGFFRDLSLSQTDIDSRYRKLSLVLHAERVPPHLSPRIKLKIAELWTELNDQKDFFSRSYHLCSSYDYHLHESKILADLAYQFKHVPQLSTYYAGKAASQYREICRIASEVNDISSMITFRTKVASMLVIQRRFVLAQIYTLMALRIVKREYSYRPDIQMPLVAQLIKNLSQIKLKACPEKYKATASSATSPARSTTSQEAPSPNSVSRVTDVALVDHDITSRIAMSTALCHMLSPEGSLVQLNIPNEAIRAQELDAVTQFKKVVVGAGAASLGAVALVAGGGYTVAVTVAATSGMIMLGPFAIIIVGVAGVIGGGYLAKKAWNKGEEIMAEVHIRREINAVLDEALQFYHQGDFARFLNALSFPIAHDNRAAAGEAAAGQDNDTTKICKTIIVYCPNDLTTPVDTHHTIEYLLSHEVSPDGIAYILNGVGEALMSGTLAVRARELDVVSNANRVFNSIISSKPLCSAATNLDNSRDTLTTTRLSGSGAFLLSFFSRFSKECSGMTEDEAHEVVDNLKNMLITDRLTEVTTVAKMNLALLYAADDDQRSVVLARDLVTEVLEYYEQAFERFPMSEIIIEKIETLRDFMTAFGMSSPCLIEDLTSAAENMPAGKSRSSDD
jgi:hypothetical protein